MKILYLHQYFNSLDMVGGTRSYEMSRYFVKSGHEVHMITSDRRADNSDKAWFQQDVDGIQVHWFPIPYKNQMGWKRRIRAFSEYAWHAGRRAVAIGGDIVFATSTPLTVALPGVYAAQRLTVPMVFEVRDLWPDLPIAIGALRHPVTIWVARRLEHYAYSHAAHVVALSPGMADGVASAGVPRHQISVIPNGCDRYLFASAEKDGERFLSKHPYLGNGKVVVYTGMLGRINGVGYLVDIARHVAKHDPSIKFLVAGEGGELEQVTARARRLDVLNRNLWIIPPLSKAAIPGLLSCATVATSLVIDLPQLWHNSANKFFDALAANCPIMINYGGWQSKILKITGAGIVVPAANAEIAADMLRAFIDNEEKLAHARRAAAQLACMHFDRSILAEQLLSILEYVVHINTETDPQQFMSSTAGKLELKKEENIYEN